MSRRSFRLDVAEARPVSAWVLVGVASATLWITQQLAPWVIAVQVSFLALSFALRTRPQPWQQHPIVLNIGMFFIVTVTIRVALRGDPSTISLAHFAALTQALQLVDTRPRRTEFLLVALALFQVVLASNLTDSVLFPPLLIAFVFATVWTLIVHTLRSEALEAGDRAAASQAITPGVIKMTLFATGMSVLLALALFIVLPRMHSSMVTGSGVGPVTATSGFSDTVALGTLGSIRHDPTVVMRVETISDEEPALTESYWRGLAFDHFDGTAWSITPASRDPVPGSVEGGIEFGHRPDQFDLVQTIVREPVEAGVVFGIGDSRSLQGTIRRLETDVNGGLYAAGQSQERVRYTIATQRQQWRDAALARDRAVPPRRQTGRYTQLPALSSRVVELAREITRGVEGDAARVRAIESWLLRNGRYSDTPPAPDTHGTDTNSTAPALEHFLFAEMAAHCEYYASALVVLARSLEIPARLVNGFAGGRRNRIGGFVEVQRSDAHAWAEIHYQRVGWVRYDATPPDLRSRALAPLSFEERIGEFASAMELWWFQRVVGFDRSDQIHAVKRAALAWQAARSDNRTAGDRSIFGRFRGLQGAPWREGVTLALCALAAATLLWRIRPRRRERSLPAAYAEALRLLSHQGISRTPCTTAREFSNHVRAAIPAAGAAFEALTESYLRERFGGRTDRAAREWLKEFRRELRAA
jgi:transglutaminase-like putative cysteine protease